MSHINSIRAFEVNFDGLVGPTHNYSGLSYGNVASQRNQYTVSNPREAALQGLEKMKLLADKGIKQAVLPPQMRPHIPTLRSLGFSGTDHAILSAAFRESPDVLLAVSSAASMWAANAATLSPSADSLDNKVHLTAANLSSKFHRSIEAETTSEILRAIFPNSDHFLHHPPLPQGSYFADEGAANHTRFCKHYGNKGVQLFIYGRRAFGSTSQVPTRFPARQTLDASAAIVRLHQLDPSRVIFSQQHPKAIDAGAFHNDVVSVGNENIFFYHEWAFQNKDELIAEIQAKLAVDNTEMVFIEVKNKDITIEDAITSYLFNSQIVSLPNGTMLLIAPSECQEKEHIRTYIETLVKSPKNPINDVIFLNLQQSMRNGGGPACLRLRAVLTENELAHVHSGVLLDDILYQKLKRWIVKHYRDRLHPNDFSDPKILEEGYRALDELTVLLNLGPLYFFQKTLENG